MFWFLLILLIFLLVFTAISFFLGRIMINYIMQGKRKTYEIIRSQDAAYAEGFDDYENLWERHPFTLPTENAEISGEYILNPNHTGRVNRVAVICHGHTVLRASDFKYARMFYRLGYHIVIFDERYFGESRAKYCTLGMMESKDIAAIIEYTRKIFGENAFIALHGESMGAASELLALRYTGVDLVIADCPFARSSTQLANVAKHRVGIMGKPAMVFARLIGIVRAGYDFNKVNPIEAVENSNVPICFIHGLEDKYIPYSHSEDMYKVSKNPLSEIHLFPGATHAKSVAVDFDGYVKILNDFVGKVEKESAKIQTLL